jgi:hypothetical protein
MRRNLGKALSLALVLAACGPTKRGHGDGDGPDASGGGGDDANTGTDDGQVAGDSCSDEAKLIYVVDENRTLSQFDPKTKTFKDLGTPDCGTPAKPFSMAIARDATAWVLYDNGYLYHIDTKNNLACTQSPWVKNTSNLLNFGMGFSTDQVGGSTDTLFISGGVSINDSVSKLHRLDLTSFQPTFIKNVVGWPELTGTGSAELWGFFPSADAARIAQLDKTSGIELRTYNESLLNNPSNYGGTTAWAFAFHGGSFWVFLKKYPTMSDTNAYTKVYQFNASTGALIGQPLDTTRKIVGAGVSTCAPVIIL